MTVLLCLLIWVTGLVFGWLFAETMAKRELRAPCKECVDLRAEIVRLKLFHEPDQTVWVDGEEVTVTEPRHITAHPHWRFGSPIRPSKGRARRGA